MKVKKNQYGYPLCHREDCFANKQRGCICLKDNDFGDRACPFFKTEERHRADLEKYGGLKDE